MSVACETIQSESPQKIQRSEYFDTVIHLINKTPNLLEWERDLLSNCLSSSVQIQKDLNFAGVDFILELNNFANKYPKSETQIKLCIEYLQQPANTSGHIPGFQQQLKALLNRTSEKKPSSPKDDIVKNFDVLQKSVQKISELGFSEMEDFFQTPKDVEEYTKMLKKKTQVLNESLSKLFARLDDEQ